MAIDPETGAINGILPLRFMQPGEIIEIEGSGKAPYKIKRLKGRDDYSCTCPSFQYGTPAVQTRSCKHLRELLGVEYDEARAHAALIRPAGAMLSPRSPKSVGIAQVPKSPPASPSSGSKRPRRNRNVVSSSTKYGLTPMPTPQTAFAALSAKAAKPALMLAHTFDLKGDLSPEGWWASEKLDGVRAHWDGKQLWSRTGKEYLPPSWWVERLPANAQLDGELFIMRDKFDETSGWIRGGASPMWADISYVVFDTVDFSAPLEKRWETARKACNDGPMTVDQIIKAKGSQIAFLEQTKVTSRAHLDELLEKVETVGGEGIMLRAARSFYKGGRSHDMLKVKTFYDAEAVVVGYKDGEGRNKGRVGSLRLRMECGKFFECGTGLKDADRDDPPEVGSLVRYAFQELSHLGVPRFPSYKGVVFDRNDPRDAVVRSAALRAANKKNGGDATPGGGAGSPVVLDDDDDDDGDEEMLAPSIKKRKK